MYKKFWSLDSGHSKTVLNNNQADQYGLHHEYAS